MTYRLYGWAGTGSAVVEAAMMLAGINAEHVDVDTSQGVHREPAFLAINPRGQVPAMTLPDGTLMTETAAILMHLADAKPEAGLAPLPGSSARATHDRWLVFMAVNLYEGELRKYYPDRYTTDPAGSGAISDAAQTYLYDHLGMIEGAIAGPFLLGSAISMADLYLWMICHWEDMAEISRRFPKIAAIVEAVKALPGFQALTEKHFPA